MAQNSWDEKPEPNSEHSRMNISMRKGLRGWFDVDGMIITVFGSNWTGREIVYITDQHGERVVSDKRSFRFSTSHEFSEAGNDYRVDLKIGVGKVELMLYRNGQLVDSDVYIAQDTEVDQNTGKIDWRKTIKQQFASFLVIFVIAFIISYFAFGLIVGALQ